MKKTTIQDKTVGKRTHAITFLLNDKEFEVVNHSLKRFKVKNRSNFFRNILIFYLLKRLDKVTPTLFDKQFDEDCFPN